MARRNEKYTQEIRERTAAYILESGQSATKTAKELGIDVNTVWTTLFIFVLFAFGMIMMTLGILGEYLWRTFDACRRRPPYIVEINDKEVRRD